MWKPKVGDRVKLKSIHHYYKYGRASNIWGWFEVLELGEKGCRVKTTSCAIGTEPEELALVYEDIQPPLYWSEVYEVTAGSAEEARKILAWLADRGGVAVWGSLDLGTAGRKMFTPGDTAESGKPHWSMNLVEIVTDRNRLDLGYEIESFEKPPKSEKGLWTYDRRSKTYYRRAKLIDESSVEKEHDHAAACSH